MNPHFHAEYEGFSNIDNYILLQSLSIAACLWAARQRRRRVMLRVREKVSHNMQNRGSQAILLFVLDIVCIDCFFFIFTRFIVLSIQIKSFVQAKTTVWWHQLDKQPQSSNSQSLFLKNTKAR